MTARQKIVAVIDDDPSMLRAASALLGARGIATVTFSSAEEFLNSGRQLDFDCLLLDIHLDGTSGFELRRMLTAAGSAIPVVFMTAIDDDTVRREAVQVGCIACLYKPFPAKQLFDALAKAMGQAS